MRSRTATAARPSYRPIADYAVIGDCHSCALVARDGSIDWLCWPRFDSPALFARLLDAEKGGFYSIAPSGDYEVSRAYLESSNILETRFRSGASEVVLTDFMPIEESKERGLANRIVRIIEGIRGEMPMRLLFEPRFDYARATAEVHAESPRSIRARSGDATLLLESDLPLVLTETGARAEFTVTRGQRLAFVLAYTDSEHPLRARVGTETAAQRLEQTHRLWREWSDLCPYRGRYHDLVKRSALTLKLLTYEPTGGIVAAPTTSLPERIGGARNWDYRYAWLRDSSLVVHALYSVGHVHYADRFVEWLCETAHAGRSQIQIMYGIHGDRELPETELGHLEGYRGSRPVRIGNAAVKQHQLDAYGELLLSIDLARQHGRDEESPIWNDIVRHVDWVCDHWRKPDQGIWEMRSRPRHFVYSKAMAWAALDRGIGAARELGLPTDFDRWAAVRDEIKREILEKGWDPELGSFVQSYGSKNLDAANLRLSQIGFLPANDPKMIATIECTRRDLMRDGLVYRYLDADDGVDGEEAAFAICSLWMVQNLADLGRLDEATRLFERLVDFGNDVGLFAEEIDPSSGQLLGNFPQAFTHVGLIAAALDLQRAIDGADGSALAG